MIGHVEFISFDELGALHIAYKEGSEALSSWQVTLWGPKWSLGHLPQIDPQNYPFM